MSAFLAQESNERVDVVLTLLTMAAMFLRLLTIGLGINYGMHPDKESGLDGMNPPSFFFFQNCWSIVGQDVFIVVVICFNMVSFHLL